MPNPGFGSINAPSKIIMGSMAEPDSANDDTVLGPAGDETVLVPGCVPIQEPEWAWSRAELPEPKIRKPLRRPVRWLLIALTVSMVAVGAFAAGRHQARQATSPTFMSLAPSAPVFASIPQPPTSTTAVPPVVGLSTTRPRAHIDQVFIDKIRAHGIPYYGGDDAALISAYSMCNAMSDRAHPMSVADLIGISQRAIPWTYEQSATFVQDAIQSFCPWQWNPE